MTITNEKKKNIIESYVNGYCVKQISQMLNVKFSTVYAISIYQKEDRIEQKLKGGQRKKKLNGVHVEAIRCMIDNDCGITLKFIKKKLFDEFLTTVCETTVDNYISYTLKIIVVIPERNIEKYLFARHEYALKYPQLMKIIFFYL